MDNKAERYAWNRYCITGRPIGLSRAVVDLAVAYEIKTGRPIPLPITEFRDESVSLAWNSKGIYVEVDLHDGGGMEWFFRDTPNDVTRGARGERELLIGYIAQYDMDRSTSELEP